MKNFYGIILYAQSFFSSFSTKITLNQCKNYVYVKIFEFNTHCFIYKRLSHSKIVIFRNTYHLVGILKAMSRNDDFKTIKCVPFHRKFPRMSSVSNQKPRSNHWMEYYL